MADFIGFGPQQLIIDIMGFTSFFYRVLIDPMLNSSHRCASAYVSEGVRVLDVACGGGTLALMAAKKAGRVLAIDIDQDMLDAARYSAEKRGVANVDFIMMDAGDLSSFSNCEFDISLISMAIHQFSTETGLSILKEMKRVSKRVVVVDYAFPVRGGFYRSFTWVIECIAGGDHYRNFRSYMAGGGLAPMLREAGLSLTEQQFRGKGTLVVCHCK